MSDVREPAQLGNRPLSGCRLPHYVLLWLKGLGELLSLFSEGTDLIPESSLSSGPCHLPKAPPPITTMTLGIRFLMYEF